MINPNLLFRVSTLHSRSRISFRLSSTISVGTSSVTWFAPICWRSLTRSSMLKAWKHRMLFRTSSIYSRQKCQNYTLKTNKWGSLRFRLVSVLDSLSASKSQAQTIRSCLCNESLTSRILPKRPSLSRTRTAATSEISRKPSCRNGIRLQPNKGVALVPEFPSLDQDRNRPATSGLHFCVQYLSTRSAHRRLILNEKLTCGTRKKRIVSYSVSARPRVLQTNWWRVDVKHEESFSTIFINIMLNTHVYC